MRRKTASYLADGLLAGRDIQAFLQEVSLEQFEDAWEKQAAVNFGFLTIGEALARVRDLEPDVFDSIPDAAQAVAFRHVVAHGYDILIPARVYGSAKENLPIC